MRDRVQNLADKFLGRMEYEQYLEGWGMSVIKYPEWGGRYQDWTVIHDMFQVASEVLKDKANAK